MSQNILATPCSTGRQGSTAKVWVRQRDHVGLLDRVESGDRGAVKADPLRQCALELRCIDRKGLQLPEDVREPKPHEADPPLADLLQNLSSATLALLLGALAHLPRTLVDRARCGVTGATGASAR